LYVRLAESMFETHVREKTTMVKVSHNESGRVRNAFSAGNKSVIEVPCIGTCAELCRRAHVLRLSRHNQPVFRVRHAAYSSLPDMFLLAVCCCCS
jgi:hypothetical protein